MSKTGGFLRFGRTVGSFDGSYSEKLPQNEFDDDEMQPSNVTPKPKTPTASFKAFVQVVTPPSPAEDQKKSKVSVAKPKTSMTSFEHFLQVVTSSSSAEHQRKSKVSVAKPNQSPSPPRLREKPNFASVVNFSTNVQRHNNDSQQLNARGNLRNNYVPVVRTRQALIDDDQKFAPLYSNVHKYDEAIRVTGNNENHVLIRNWTEAGLSSKMKTNIADSCYISPRNIQKYVIPLINSGKSFKAQSETGSGKTCGYLIPLIDRIAKAKLKDPSCVPDFCAPRVIIIVVCRELAIQVCENALKLGYNTGVITDMCYGKYSPNDNAKKLQESGTDILISTTERLFDFLDQRIIVLTRLETLVFDDADRLFEKESYEKFIENAKMTCKGDLQILLLSATYYASVNQLAVKYLGENHINVINEHANEPNSRIIQTFELVKKDQKIDRASDYCKRILEKYPGQKPRILIFVNECEVAENVVKQLKSDNIEAEAYSRFADQEKRERFVNEFQKSTLQILVASDVSAYGIDIKGLNYVLLYDLPRFRPAFLTYVQRIGRTGRLAEGYAHSFYDPDTDRRLRNEIVYWYRSKKVGNIKNPEVLLKN